MQNFVDIWERVKKVSELRTLDDLANCVEQSKPTIMRRKAQNFFSGNWAFLIGQKFGLSTDWIMTGTGPMKLDRHERATGALSIENGRRKYKAIEDLEMWLDEIVKADPERSDWFKVELKKAFPEYLEWLKNREALLEDSPLQGEVA